MKAMMRGGCQPAQVSSSPVWTWTTFVDTTSRSGRGSRTSTVKLCRTGWAGSASPFGPGEAAPAASAAACAIHRSLVMRSASNLPRSPVSAAASSFTGVRASWPRSLIPAFFRQSSAFGPMPWTAWRLPGSCECLRPAWPLSPLVSSLGMPVSSPQSAWESGTGQPALTARVNQLIMYMPMSTKAPMSVSWSSKTNTAMTL